MPGPDDPPDDGDLMPPIEGYATWVHETYNEFQRAGFSRDQAFTLTLAIVSASWGKPTTEE